MYWYRLEHSPSDLLSRAYNECKSSKNQSNNLLFFSEKLNINLSICKKFSKNKFKLYLKKYLQKSLLETWLDIRNSYLLDTRKLRERPFNLKGGYGFFLNILIPNVAEKNILILVEEKKNNLIRVFVI
jgi:uncharacterized protein YukJ